MTSDEFKLEVSKQADRIGVTYREIHLSHYKQYKMKIRKDALMLNYTYRSIKDEQFNDKIYTATLGKLFLNKS